MPDNSIWLTPAELAARLGVTVGTVRHWRAHGTGPRGCRLGRHLRYALADVVLWEDERRTQASLPQTTQAAAHS